LTTVKCTPNVSMEELESFLIQYVSDITLYISLSLLSAEFNYQKNIWEHFPRRECSTPFPNPTPSFMFLFILSDWFPSHHPSQPSFRNNTPQVPGSVIWSYKREPWNCWSSVQYMPYLFYWDTWSKCCVV
jgi:hypothetical protein